MTSCGGVFTVFTMSDQREKILSCACELYLNDGLDGFSMRKLARSVGVTAPALYRHYESKEHVLIDVVREAYREFTGFLYRALEGRTPEERLAKAGDGYIEFGLRHPRWYRIVFTAADRLGLDELPADVEAQGCAIHQFWVDRLRECMDAGLLRRGDPAAIGMTIWAHSHGLITLYHNGHFQTDEEGFCSLCDASWQRLLEGVATDEYIGDLKRRDFASVTAGST